MTRNKNQMDWEKRMFVLMKKNQGWSNMDLAKHFNCTPQSISAMYQKVKGMSVKELEDEYNNYIRGDL